MNKSNLIITLVINTLIFVLLIGCYETVEPSTSSTTKIQQPKQSTKTILWISLMLQITMTLLIIYDMTVGF